MTCTAASLGNENTLRFRLMSNLVETEAGCWEWQGAQDRKGYGSIGTGDGRTALTHRVAWVLERGNVPDDLPLDHLCENTLCANPDHLEPVSLALNSRRKYARGGDESRLDTHCRFGHAYKLGTRYCRECNTARTARWRAKKKG